MRKYTASIMNLSNFVHILIKTLINIHAKVYLNPLTRLKVIYLKLQQNKVIFSA